MTALGRLGAALVTLSMLAACGSSDGDDTADADPTAVPTVVEEEAAAVDDEVEATAETDEPADVEEAPADSEESEPSEPEPTVPAEPEVIGEPFIGGGDLPEVLLLTPVSGGGDRPLLEWEPAPEATAYHVFVFGPDAVAYWAWEGTETSVVVGGVELSNPDAPGPRITEGMTWSVLAVGDDGIPVAVSEERPIGP